MNPHCAEWTTAESDISAFVDATAVPLDYDCFAVVNRQSFFWPHGLWSLHGSCAKLG
jgi:hypothetical protein